MGSEAAVPLVRLEVSYQLRNYYLCAVPCSPTSPVLVATRLPACLRQAMVQELDGQIDLVAAEITKVGGEIDEVVGQLKLVDQLEDPELREVRRAELLEEKKRLGKEKEQLRKEKEDLRAEKQLLLTAQLQPPGVVPLLFVFIVHAQPASLLAASSALCTRFCLLSLALASHYRIYILELGTNHSQFKLNTVSSKYTTRLRASAAPRGSA